MRPTRPQTIEKIGLLTIVTEYFEDIRFSKIQELLFYYNIKYFRTEKGVTTYILDNRYEGAYIIYKCKNGYFVDGDLDNIAF